MKGNQKAQDNLDDIYSDFSDNEESQKRKSAPSARSGPPQPSVAIKMPLMFGGKHFFPPPPPNNNKPASKAAIPEEILQSRPQHGQGQHGQGQHGQRERKSTIFIKNIPKTCNKQETLTTFFRTFGNIKSIKTSEEQNTAAVRFERQQDAYRFMTTKPLILNRSYIVYDTNENFPVPASCLAEKEKDEVVTINSSEKEVIILKENTESLVAEKYRCLLFLAKHRDRLTEKENEEVAREMNVCKKIKESESSNHELGELLMNFENDYDWTLTYRQVTKELVDKKKKYGPIGIITAKLSPALQPNPALQPSQPNEDKVATIKIKFLAPRSSWQMYLDNCLGLALEVEGGKLSSIFKSWFAQKNQEEAQLEKEQTQHQPIPEGQDPQQEAENQQPKQEVHKLDEDKVDSQQKMPGLAEEIQPQ